MNQIYNQPILCGLYNQSLQTNILAKAGYLTSLEGIVKQAEAFESTLRDQLHFHNPVENATRIFEFDKLKKFLNPVLPVGPPDKVILKGPLPTQLGANSVFTAKKSITIKVCRQISKRVNEYFNRTFEI